MIDTSEWCPSVLCPAKDLHLSLTLCGGQTFSWYHHDGLFIGELYEVPIILFESAGVVYYKSPSREKAHESLTKYFRLDHDLGSLLSEWQQCDPEHFGALKEYPAIRWLRQPWQETLFAFICSQNNGIGRIHTMVMQLRRSFGKHLGDFQISPNNIIIPIYTFPFLSHLSAPSVENELRILKFGYRARYIQQAALHLANGEVPQSIEDLLEIPGVGPKVAACIALFGLDHGHVVPVDVHMWRVAQLKGIPGSGKTLTPTLHQAISQRFAEQFGEYAGWAHLIMFANQRSKRKTSKSLVISAE